MASKKSQIWGLDVMIAFTIFLIGIISFLIYSFNYSGGNSETFESLASDGRIIADSIISSGYPQDWNSNNVQIPGIVDSGKINNTKLERLYNLSQSNYQKTKSLFKTQYDYFFFLSENLTINSQQVVGIGKPGINPLNISSSNLVKTTRITAYNNKPVTAYIYVWEAQ